MILRNKTKKLQTGASLNLAKNIEPVPFVPWKQFDLSGYKQAPLNLPASAYSDGYGSGSGRSGAGGGLPSDIAYVRGQLDLYKNKIKEGLSGPNAEDYGQTQAKIDSDEVKKWSEALVSLKAREDNYKTSKTNVMKGANNDYAISGNKALVIDNTTGTPTFVTPMDVLTERIKNENGKIAPKYSMLTMGDALSLRFNNPEFSGFNEETGGVLDRMFSTVQDSEGIEKDMTNLFSKVGSVVPETETLVTNNGQSYSIMDLVNSLESAGKKYNTGLASTNEPNLEHAVGLFTNSLSAAQNESLTAKAMGQFMEQFGNQEIPEANIAQWVQARKNATITEKALAFLKTKRKTGGKSGKGAEEPSLAKKEIDTNRIELNRWGGTGKTVQLAVGDYKDADDLKQQLNILATIPASELTINEAVFEGVKGKELKDVGKLATNPFIRTLSQDIRNNLFLADEDSTPVASLNNNNGLETSVVNTSSYGGAMRILRDMPYTEDNTGRKKIAWGKVKEAMDFGKEFNRRCEAKATAEGKERLTEAESISVNEEMKAEGKGFIMDPNMHMGDIAMIPIIVYDTDKNYDEDSLDTYMQSGISKEEKDLITNIPGVIDMFSSGEKKRTFAFSVLSNSTDMKRKNAYGPAMEVKEKINVGDALKQIKSAQRMGSSAAVLDFLASTASINITKE